MTERTLRPTSVVLGLVFVGLGIAFLLDQLDAISLDVSYLLPAALIGFGVAVVAGAFAARRPSADRGGRV